MLLIDGASLNLCLYRNNLKEIFFKLALKVETVACCRCSPTQKSMIAENLTELNKNRVLAIGDGGNDVGMIRVANIGVGIEGKEGVQAALASDFSLTEFRHIVKLILWHGRINYKRICVMANFVVHRGLIISIIQFSFIIINNMIDVPIFNGWLATGYCTVFTALPVFALIFDVDLDFETTSLFPIIYKKSLSGRKLGTKSFLVWFMISIYQGTCIMFCAML